MIIIDNYGQWTDTIHLEKTQTIALFTYDYYTQPEIEPIKAQENDPEYLKLSRSKRKGGRKRWHNAI